MSMSHRVLLQVFLLICLSFNVICIKNLDQSKLIADRPKNHKPTSLWDSSSTNLKYKQTHIPPYAVKMEPLVHYSQHDPLYTNSTNVALDKVIPDSSAKGSEPRISTDYGPPGTNYGVPFQQDYYKEPEPIIEIIIKESNESLPLPATPPPTPVTRPSKEPVQVFYVKYKKNPNSYGNKEDVIYEAPIPAITPSAETESETTYASEVVPQYTYATEAPAPSTTYRTIIKPDSEIYHGSGLKVTFGKTEQKWSSTLDEAQKRDSISAPSEEQNKLNTSIKEHKRSYIEPNIQHTEYQRINNFASTPQNSNHPLQGIHHLKNNLDQPQQFKKTDSLVQNLFRDQNSHSRIQGHESSLKLQQNNFEGIVEQRPLEFNENYKQQQFNQHNIPAFQLNPPQIFTGVPQERVVQPSKENQFINKPFETHPYSDQSFEHQLNQNRHLEQHLVQNRPFEQQPPPFEQPFQNKPAIQQSGNNRPFEHQLNQNRPYEQHLIQNRPFEQQFVQNRPFEQLSIQNRPFDNRQIQNHPIINRPFENNLNIERPFENRTPNQNIINYRPHSPPTNSPSVPPNSNNPFVPSDRRPLQPPQFAGNFNNQLVGTKHSVELKFLPQQSNFPSIQPQQSQILLPQFTQGQFQQPQFQQPLQKLQFQQPQFLQQQFRPEVRRPLNNNSPTFTQQQTEKQQFNPEIKTAFTQIQHQFNSDAKPTSSPQFQITPSNEYTIDTHQQSVQSGQINENFKKYQHMQPEQNSFRTNSTWQIINSHQSSQKVQDKEFISPSTMKSSIDFTHKSVLKTTEKSILSPVTPQYKDVTTIGTSPKPVTQEVIKDESKKTDSKKVAVLPDEVPDELREQLLSSGILSNADIQILDYDKVGDIPIESLPPEALENLYGSQGQASDPVPSIALPLNSTNVQMKIIKYDPTTEEGKNIENKYMDRPKAHTLDPVVLNDTGYNRFLPLNINGSQFPIPNSPLLKNKAIGSVVILSPVAYDLSDEQTRSSRNTAVQVKGVHFIVGDIVKNLVKDPSRRNFETWLQKEKMTPANEQSVILLVTKPLNKLNGKEIYMYDVTHNRVSKLSGDLSATFVNVAESNSQSHDLDNLSSDQEVDVVVSGNRAKEDPQVVSGYSRMNNFSSKRRNATSNN
ncbi:uncharacterized protein LOC126904214 [Daktulosphaira vitifoliae]|uniref:uncharacterized protein LOC126904214 n=1 Tax=Daktulosphaira vitifoliae TaxID=58002 RepID=UPI0021A9C571|nr:uncharacterized protein LOC126904214 [Daktulosphaira vitifoliae]